MTARREGGKPKRAIAQARLGRHSAHQMLIVIRRPGLLAVEGHAGGVAGHLGAVDDTGGIDVVPVATGVDREGHVVDGRSNVDLIRVR